MIQEDLSDDAIRLGVLVNTEQSRRLDRAITCNVAKSPI
jgi:hypothetical protein